jgi:hypothetical protein
MFPPWRVFIRVHGSTPLTTGLRFQIFLFLPLKPEGN